MTKKTSVLQSGFTIVELLIVVVVIAILAAITIVSYNGIQQRASAARTAHAASTYNSALIAYQSLNGSYPALSPGNGGACLGSGYRDRNSDGLGDCGESAWPVNEDTAFNTALKTLISSTPVANDKPIKMPYQTGTWVGASYHYYPPNPADTNPQTTGGFMVDGVSKPHYIMYVVEGGNAACSLSNLVMPDETLYGWPKMTANLSAGRNWSWSDGSTTACVGYLP